MLAPQRIHLKQWIEDIYKPRFDELFDDQGVNGGLLTYWESSDSEANEAIVYSPVKTGTWFWLVLDSENYVIDYGENQDSKAAIEIAEGYLKPAAISA